MCPSGSDPHLKSNTIFDFRQAFNVLDTDQDGKISRDDLKTFYSNFIGTNLANDEDIGSMISIADWNKNGFVEFDEFEKVLGCQKNAKTMNTSMEDVFKVMDRDGDGKIGFDDLKHYLKWAGVSANDDDVKAMIKLGGEDDKEGVGYQGLLKILSV
ncbi:Calcium-binding protein cp1 [Thalictrum thalictroides]|uniref:Calcium-binding protein cp1 n=1 Tax=Thalictrum thalictroides TaxID=46969 RepID=A0A7J6W0S6_THATH|nr:Calcium-binding protein cp1 [Thalictrum thalictroides]